MLVVVVVASWMGADALCCKGLLKSVEEMMGLE